MYSLLPHFDTPSELLTLPVELWLNILRMLDPISLLTAVRACPAWMRISEDDSILKKTLKTARKLEVKLALEIIHGSLQKRVKTHPNRIDDLTKYQFRLLPIYMNPVEILTRRRRTKSRKDPACNVDKKFIHCRI
ncbi:unnamed protein product [Phyllotreta striolata]|uniref:F-box domain-containing protein n=1 Tax=Phyllotreta striolata TaxID=444603 RepID=A0A9N9TMP7_PHYSR|nr:unnamed protein product [Phyllotreta striolata]